MILRSGLALALACALAGAPVPARAGSLLIDRAAVRFVSPETGGASSPRFVFERELAFEARLEALADPDHVVTAGDPYRPRHARSALERHIAETLLESLDIDPPPTGEELSARTEAARLGLYERAGGGAAIGEAARAEGITPTEVTRMLRRQARASLYLDRMVAPMLDPSEAELRAVHRTARTPFSAERFEKVEPALRRWYVSGRLAEALLAFYEGARSRLIVSVLD